MITQISAEFDYLKYLPLEEIENLKKEMKDIVNGGTPDQFSNHLEKVNETLANFKRKANKGQLTRQYVDAQEVMKACAGCASYVHGRPYWQECEYTNVHGEKVTGFKVTPQWRASLT